MSKMGQLYAYLNSNEIQIFFFSGKFYLIFLIFDVLEGKRPTFDFAG